MNVCEHSFANEFLTEFWVWVLVDRIVLSNGIYDGTNLTNVGNIRIFEWPGRKDKKLRNYGVCLTKTFIIVLIYTLISYTVTIMLYTTQTQQRRQSAAILVSMIGCLILLLSAIPQVHGFREIQNDDCRELGYGKNCTDNPGCAACHWKLNIPHWNFCVSNGTASHLPKFLFECCSSGDTPAPEPPHAQYMENDEVGSPCMDLNTEEECTGNAACSWCISQAVPSQCFSKEDASKLPPAVFACSSLDATKNTKEDVLPF
jgi:hypothetical protein